MKMNYWLTPSLRLTSCLLAASTLSLAATPTARADDDPPVRTITVPINNAVQDGQATAIAIAVTDSGVVDLGKYWIGISVGEVSDTLRDQLDIKDGVGIVALDVVDKGPAHAAGILKHDVLLKAGDTDLHWAKNLVNAVNKAETKELVIELIRKGQRKTVTVKPSERPADQVAALARLSDPAKVGQRQHIKGPNGEDIEIILTQPGRPTTFVQPGVPFAGPPIGLPQIHIAQRAPLPPGVSVSISRTNNDPAKISVKRGSESWEITDRELDKLPADLRPHVQAMLNPPQAPIAVPVPQPLGRGPRIAQPKPVAPVDEAAKKADVDKLRQQLEELSRKLDQLNEKGK